MTKKILSFLIGFLALSGQAQDILGDWMGEVDFNGGKLGFTFRVSAEEDSLQATMDIPKQGLSDYNADRVVFSDSSLTISFSNLHIEYKGQLNAKNEFIGAIYQGNKRSVLNLKRGKSVLCRPQTPQAPFPYLSENLFFENTSDHVKIAATLTIPKQEGRYPLVLLISGSGPQNRDGDLFGHKLYYVLADYLTRQGIAVLRYDERGVGQSEGSFSTAGIDDFTSDVNAALAYLQTRKDLQISKTGLIGHSLGGIIAPKIASTSAEIDFLVLLAGPGIDGDQLLLSQKAAMEKLMGLTDFQIAQGQAIMKEAYAIVTKTNLEQKELADSIHAFYLKKYGNLIPEDQRNQLVEQITNLEVLGLIRSKPSEYLEKVSCPVLALNGSKDFQVPAKANLAAIKKSLAKNGNKHVKVTELKNLNHLFQECTTGALTEYAEIEQTFSPAALKIIANWILKQVK